MTKSSNVDSLTQVSGLLDLPVFEPGWVWLAGAGPGNPGLLTLLGAYAIAQADVILYDALVNVTLLKLARPEAQLIYAGKRRGGASVSQKDISLELRSFAGQRRRVLRLKGGDPFVFGRGGEEALALAHARIPFRIIPGVTAGIGGLAYAGIPVTHRDTNHAVTFITGHGPDGNLPVFDWRSLAKGSPVLVFYMALAHADEIAQTLMASGRKSSEPAAIISNATNENQSVVVTTLSELGARARECAAPAVLVIGENVRLRETLDWVTRLNEEI
jgi:uroporphyrin-III C-methyltransferase